MGELRVLLLPFPVAPTIVIFSYIPSTLANVDPASDDSLKYTMLSPTLFDDVTNFIVSLCVLGSTVSVCVYPDVSRAVFNAASKLV